MMDVDFEPLPGGYGVRNRVAAAVEAPPVASVVVNCSAREPACVVAATFKEAAEFCGMAAERSSMVFIFSSTARERSSVVTVAIVVAALSHSTSPSPSLK